MTRAILHIVTLAAALAIVGCEIGSNVPVSNERLIQPPKSHETQYRLVSQTNWRPILQGGELVYINGRSQLVTHEGRPLRTYDNRNVFMNSDGDLITISGGYVERLHFGEFLHQDGRPLSNTKKMYLEGWPDEPYREGDPDDLAQRQRNQMQSDGLEEMRRRQETLELRDPSNLPSDIIPEDVEGELQSAPEANEEQSEQVLGEGVGEDFVVPMPRRGEEPGSSVYRSEGDPRLEDYEQMSEEEVAAYLADAEARVLEERERLAAAEDEPPEADQSLDDDSTPGHFEWNMGRFTPQYQVDVSDENARNLLGAMEGRVNPETDRTDSDQTEYEEPNQSSELSDAVGERVRRHTAESQSERDATETDSSVAEEEGSVRDDRWYSDRRGVVESDSQYFGHGTSSEGDEENTPNQDGPSTDSASGDATSSDDFSATEEDVNEEDNTAQPEENAPEGGDHQVEELREEGAIRRFSPGQQQSGSTGAAQRRVTGQGAQLRSPEQEIDESQYFGYLHSEVGSQI